tara:strand:- start:1245 stop:1658 length:414 start_codon:yes stop_codon:yes gene_type:complete
MNINHKDKEQSVINDERFTRGLELFNKAQWYEAHDIFEDLWHELQGPERKSIQGILQIAVAQLHLERGNLKGATILYGEGLGRLRSLGTPNLGLNMEKLCDFIQQRLKSLQEFKKVKYTLNPSLDFISNSSFKFDHN